jgi:hypothetical protein
VAAKPLDGNSGSLARHLMRFDAGETGAFVALDNPTVRKMSYLYKIVKLIRTT